MKPLEKLLEQATPLPWVAIRGDVLNHERAWGISQYLSLDVCKSIDGEDAEPNSRTEVIAEVCEASGGRDEADAILITHAVNMLPKLVAALELYIRHRPPGTFAGDGKWERMRALLEEAKNPPFDQ